MQQEVKAYTCPHCGGPIKVFEEYCSYCGSGLKWEHVRDTVYFRPVLSNECMLYSRINLNREIMRRMPEEQLNQFVTNELAVILAEKLKDKLFVDWCYNFVDDSYDIRGSIVVKDYNLPNAKQQVEEIFQRIAPKF